MSYLCKEGAGLKHQSCLQIPGVTSCSPVLCWGSTLSVCGCRVHVASDPSTSCWWCASHHLPGLFSPLPEVSSLNVAFLLTAISGNGGKKPRVRPVELNFAKQCYASPSGPRAWDAKPLGDKPSWWLSVAEPVLAGCVAVGVQGQDQ